MKINHAIIVYGPALSGKTTWAKTTGATMILEWPIGFTEEGIKALRNECTFLCVEVTGNPRFAKEFLERAGWTVSFRACDVKISGK